MRAKFTFNHNPVLSEKIPLWRARFVLLLLLLAMGALVVRAMWLQGVKNNFLQAKGESRYERVIELPATRGRILDRHGDVLAISSPVRSIWAIPDDAQLTPAQSRQLAALLNLDVTELSHKLGSDKDFVYLKRQVPPEQAEKITALNLPGIHSQTEYRRFYPSSEVAAHVVGFTDVDDKGQEGIELAFQKYLVGRAGNRRVIKDRRGHIVEDVDSINKPQEGSDVDLALDAKVQYLAYSALQQAVTANKAKAGSAIVLDARTGEVLALVNSPTYNPNNRIGLSGEQLRNRALTDTFEPGSIMKPFTAALAIETGRFRPDTVINCAPGRMTIGTATISDSHAHGALTVAEVIQKSSNIGSAKMALTMPPEEMWRMFDSLHFGTAPKLGFSGRGGGASAAVQILAADRAGHDVLRSRHLGDLDADRPGLSRFCPRWRSDPDLAVEDRSRARTRAPRLFGEDCAHDQGNARDGDPAGRNRDSGSGSRLPGGRQDRHRLQARRRRLCAQNTCLHSSGSDRSPIRA